MGRVLEVFTDSVDYKITGVMKDIPENSHIFCNFVVDFQKNNKANQTQWTSNNIFTYLLLEEEMNTQTLDEKILGRVACDDIYHPVSDEMMFEQGTLLDEFKVQWLRVKGMFASGAILPRERASEFIIVALGELAFALKLLALHLRGRLAPALEHGRASDVIAEF